MNITIHEMNDGYLSQGIEIWNEIVEEGLSFPDMEQLDEKKGKKFFDSQSFTGVAVNDDDEVVGLYILHPNNIGRCAHLANASYAVKKELRGQHIGGALVVHSLKKAKELGFGVLMFNAVCASNKAALTLYEKLGFTRLGVIPKGFRRKDGSYDDIIPHFHEV
ncbi:MAG: GNAT family N-acetyltransferase [Oscillospiraceae bacterium]|nr:GNAT family N-acetyltransferase [Oscillospiraceae bacterium]